MTDEELKARIDAFAKGWGDTIGEQFSRGERSSEPENDSGPPIDWDKYGSLHAHLLRFCRALLLDVPDKQWEWTERAAHGSSEEWLPLWNRDWESTKK